MANIIEIKAPELMTYYWGLAMLGRFMGAGLLYVSTSPRRLMQYCGYGALILLITYLFTNKSNVNIGADASLDPALYLLVMVGLCNSIMWPAVFTMGIDGMGKYTITAASFIVASIAGGAIIPYVLFYFEFSVWSSILMMLAAYSFVIWFGLKGSRYEKESNFY
jgi:FHS family L-fucose permease-like MFS transporter